MTKKTGSHSATTQKVGDLIDVPEGANVTRPDGTEITVTGGAYALDVAGVHHIDGTEVTAK